MSKSGVSQERRRRSLLEQRLSRARFLQLVGSGVGLSFLPASLASLGAGVASAQTTTSGVPTILTGPEFPIGLWWPPPPAHTNNDRYKEIFNAGFNFVIGGNGVQTDSINKTALQAAGAVGRDPSTNKPLLRFLLWDSKLVRLIRDLASQQEVNARIKQLLQLFPVSQYPALAGLCLRDEPHKKYFPILGYARGVLQGLDSKHLPWVNLYGYTTDPNLTGVSTYQEYLRLYLEQVKPPFLSFDHYPLVSDTAITARCFENWALVREYSRQAGIPSWGFIQSVDFSWTSGSFLPRRRPNENELFWQVNVALAYGAKGLQYFTYWTPNDSDSITFGEALLTETGRRTPLYDHAQNVNKVLKVVGKVLLPLKSESVVHAQENPLPTGTTAFSPDGYVNSVSGSPLILGSFSNPAAGTERYLLVVNRSFSSPTSGTKLTLNASEPNPRVSAVSALDSGTGTFAEVPAPQNAGDPGYDRQGGVLTPEPIPAGRARLYRLQITISSSGS
jgi:hypothetical protein